MAGSVCLVSWAHRPVYEEGGGGRGQSTDKEFKFNLRYQKFIPRSLNVE